MNYASLSAKELEKELERALVMGPEGAIGWGFFDALKEVERLRIVCQDIVDIINTDSDIVYKRNILGGIDKISDKAQEYFMPDDEACANNK